MKSKITLILLALLLYGACVPTEEPKKSGQPEVSRVYPTKGKQSVQKPEPKAQFLFLVPPRRADYPEWAYLTEDFRRGAKKVFESAGWEYSELDLSSILVTRWAEAVLQSLKRRPAVIFTFSDSYVPFLKELAWESRLDACVVFALTSPVAETSPMVLELRLRADELGFLAGVMAAQKTVTGDVVVLAYKDELLSDEFVSGLAQGLRLERAGSHLHDIRISRAELVKPGGAKMLAELYAKAQKSSASRFGVDVVVSFLGPLADGFLRELAGADVPVISSFVPDMEKSPRAYLTSMLFYFSLLPEFLVKNAEKLNLLKSFPLARRPKEGLPKGVSTRATTEGAPTYLLGPRYYEIGIRDGILGHSGFEGYLRFHELPPEFTATLNYYIKAISLGEIKVKGASQKE